MPNVNLTAPYSTQQAELDRRRQMAQALQQSSMAPLEMPTMPGVQISPISGIAKLLEGFIAARQGKKLDREQGELDTSRQNAIKEQMAKVLGSQGGSTTLGVPGLPMATQNPVDVTLPPNQFAQADALSSEFPQVQQFAQALIGEQFKQQGEQRADTRDQSKVRNQQAFQQALAVQQQSFQRSQFQDEASLRKELANVPQAGSGPYGTYFQTGPQAGQTITPQTPQQPQPSAVIQEYTYYANQEKAAGRTPKSFDAYQEQDANRKKPAPLKMVGEMSPQQFSAMMQMSNAVKSHPMYVDMLDIDTGLSNVSTGLKQKNGFGDITAINGFQRMVDPGATVRSEDVVLIQSASGMLQKVLSEYPLEKLKSGAQLPQQVRDWLQTTAKELHERRATNYNDTVGNQYRQQAAVAQIPFELIGRDFAVAGAPKVTTGGASGFRIVP